jgi:glycosyltransferase involved in cell wall biosynthesis
VRILVVTHRFPPRSYAGTEVYALEAARRVAARGHDVHVLSAWKEVSLRHGARLERTFEGLPVVEFVDNLFEDNFRATWDRPWLDARLGGELDRVRPDVVHVHHLMYLSTGLLEEARRRGIPVVYTLHDAWLGCARFGQLRHADGALCARVDPARCATCLPSYPWRQSPSAIRVGNALASIRALTHLDLFPLVRVLQPRPRTRTPSGKLPIPPAPVREAYAQHVRARGEELRARAGRSVQRFLAPSEWVARTMIEWGLPPERVFTLDTGVDVARFTAAPREPRGDRVRVRFLGTLVPHKGAHVVLEAWERLPADVRARGDLALFGPDHHDPAYVERLREVAARTGARILPPLQRDAVVRELARTDVLVVPSQWYENRPLVILEALAAGVPVLCTDLGGMRELVREGVQGHRFPFDDSQLLRDLLAQFLADPTLLDALRPRADERLLPTWEVFTDELMRHYDEVQRAPHSASTR